MQRVVAYLLSVASSPDDVDRTEDALDDKPAPIPEALSPGAKQPLEYLLAFDVEATCVQGMHSSCCFCLSLTSTQAATSTGPTRSSYVLCTSTLTNTLTLFLGMAHRPAQVVRQGRRRSRPHPRGRRRVPLLRQARLASQALRFLHIPHRHHPGPCYSDLLYAPAHRLPRPTLVRLFVYRSPASIHVSLDCAPQFKTLLRRFQAFLAKHGLVDPRTGKPMKRFAFCTDGPFDVRDFCVKTAFINKVGLFLSSRVRRSQGRFSSSRCQNGCDKTWSMFVAPCTHTSHAPTRARFVAFAHTIAIFLT
jgi:hypothetical protein